MRTSKEVTEDFFEALLAVLAKNTSKNYGLIVFKNIKKQLIKEFPFFSLVNISDSTIKIERMINSIEIHELGMLLERIIEILGPDILKFLLKENLDKQDVIYLHKIGVKI